MSTGQLQMLVIAALVFIVLASAILISFNTRKRRRDLRRRFGPEYDRAVEQHGSVVMAERELAARARRLQRFRLHELNEADRIHFTNAWLSIQATFVDDPSAAVNEASKLIKTVMQAHGYPVEDFEHRVEDLSVEHAHVVQHYRAARVLSQANREGRANTEELRQAFVHYRGLFTDLLPEPKEAHPSLLEARA